MACPLAKVFLSGPDSAQRVGGSCLVPAEALPRPAERSDCFVLARSADPQLAPKAAGSAINSMNTSGPIPELSNTQVGRDYYVRFVCPRCFRSKWVLKRDLDLTLEEVLNRLWEFECAVHGPLREKPLEASEKKPIVREEEE